MKRSKVSRKRIFLVFFFFIILIHSEAITDDKEIGKNPELVISHIFEDVDIPFLIESLNRGYESQIIIKIRLYEKKTENYFLSGDKLISSFQIIKNAEMDIFSKSYKLTNKENTLYYQDESSFLNDYLYHEVDLSAENIKSDDLSSYYVKIKTILTNKVFIKPFNILYLANFNNKITTGWLKSDILQE